MDVKTTFFNNNNFKEEVYMMKQPKRFVKLGSEHLVS
jgi:hypothetical protein